MEKTTKKTAGAKKSTTTRKTVAKKVPAKVEKVQVVAEPVNVEQPVKEMVAHKKGITLNQEFNLVIGFLSLLTIIALCFEFSSGDFSVSGWELFVYGGKLISGAFQGLMIVYALAIIIDCVMAICVNSENPVFDIIEKVLYMFTIVINFITIATLLSLISKVGLGLIIVFILSIVSVIIKFARIYASK
jgi:hypothetical protein